MYSELEEIQARWGITPIIAHVDRYLNLLTTYGIPQRLEELPVLVQANAGFFLRAGTRAWALRMLERDQIQLLGSDCHNLSSRPPNLDKALRVIGRHLPAAAIERISLYQEQVLQPGEVIPRHGHHYVNGVCEICGVDEDNPQTGDTSFVSVWVGIMAVAAAGLVAVTAAYRKKFASR